jgi:hypothetical protein
VEGSTADPPAEAEHSEVPAEGSEDAGDEAGDGAADAGAAEHDEAEEES